MSYAENRSWHAIFVAAIAPKVNSGSLQERLSNAGWNSVSFLHKIQATYRAVNEGRMTAAAHRMSEELLQTRLPTDVGIDAFSIVARMADYTSIEQMAMIYVITYANRMEHYLPAVNATEEFRTRVTRSIARACILLARMQRSGTSFGNSWINQLILAAKKHGVNADSEQIRFALS